MENLQIVAILMLPLLILGFFGNSQLVYVTLKYKQFQHRNGLLVAIIATFDLVSELFETANATEILIGKSMIERRTCYNIIFMYGYSFNMSATAVLSLAIDRLLAVLSPARYRMIRSARFIALTVTGGFIYSTPFVVAGFILEDNTLIPLCNPPTAYAPALMHIWIYGYVSIAIIVVVLNTVNFFTMQHARRKYAKQDATTYHRQMYGTMSLLVMMVVYSLTILLATFILVMASLLSVSEKTTADITSYTCLLVLINYGSNYYVLFWRSDSYRKIFLRQLHLSNNGVTVLVAEAITTACDARLTRFVGIEKKHQNLAEMRG